MDYRFSLPSQCRLARRLDPRTHPRTSAATLPVAPENSPLDPPRIRATEHTPRARTLPRARLAPRRVGRASAAFTPPAAGHPPLPPTAQTPPLPFARSPLPSCPAWVAREPDRQKLPLTVGPVESVRAAAARRFSMRNSDTSSCDIGRASRSRYIFKFIVRRRLAGAGCGLGVDYGLHAD